MRCWPNLPLLALPLLALALLSGALPARPAAAQAPASTGSAARTTRHPVLMISIDGLHPGAVLEADRYGLKIPVLRRFLTEGSYARAVINMNPTVTNPNHTTLVTGVLPREHGIYNNRPFAPTASLPQSYSDYSQIKAPTLWGAAKGAGLKTASIFWPVTRNAGAIDTNLIAGDDEDDEQIGRDAIALIERDRPDLLTVHFVSFDHRQHESGPLSAEGNAALERIDAVIGRIVAAQRKVHPDAVVAIVSDHGFYAVHQQMHLNAALAGAGFITLGSGPKPEVTSWSTFAWYIGGAAMIMLKDPADRQNVARTRAFLETLARQPGNGIDRIYSRDEIAGTGFAPEASFVVAFKPGYRMGNAMSGPLVTASRGGGHGAFSTRTVRPDMHSAFFIAGPGIAAGKDLGTIDMRRIAPTVAGVLKVRLPSACGGVFERQPASAADHC